MTMLLGNITTNVSTDGQNVDLTIEWRYPNANAETYEGEEQPTTPPVELSSVEFRLTDNRACLVDPEDTSIKWYKHFHGTGDAPTAYYDDDLQQWYGYEDSTTILGLPVRSIWYYQARVWSRGGIPSDWTDLQKIFDTPEEIPAPVITSIKTNNKDSVKLEWSDVAAEIVNFSHYEVLKEELNTDARLEVNAKIVNPE